MTKISMHSAQEQGHEVAPVSPSKGVGVLRITLAVLTVALLATACNSKSNTPTTPTAKANKLIQQGLTAQSAGLTQKAVNDFNAAIADNPADTYAYYDLGVLYQTRLDNSTSAATEYHKALLANPNYRPALFNLAILETPSDPQGAITLYNQILMLNPNDADTYFNLGLLLIAQNQPTPGHTDLEKAIMLTPSLASRVPKGITP